MSVEVDELLRALRAWREVSPIVRRDLRLNLDDALDDYADSDIIVRLQELLCALE